MKSGSDEVAAFLAGYPENVGDLALRLRQTILSTVPGALEMLDRPGKVVGYGFGSGYSDLVCTIIPSRTGVKLGIVNGADLKDPDGLLEGAGKRHRYVVIKTASDLERPGLPRLLKTAVDAWKARSKRSR